MRAPDTANRTSDSSDSIEIAVDLSTSLTRITDTVRLDEPVFVGDYRLIASLGRGGMAEVFLAVRSGMAGFHKLVVIKRLRRDLLIEPHRSKYRRLLLDEGRLAARLSHPNIVQTFEAGEADGLPFLAMEYLDGQPLSRVLARVWRGDRPLAIEFALQIVIDVLSGLAHAHGLVDYDGEPLHVIHRDISPDNVFWTYDGAIKLLDFGVAKFSLSTAETDTGVVKGKFPYMAPEQARGKPIDRRADLFAVGIVMWELIAGRHLLHAPTTAASVERLLYGELPPLSHVVPDIDPEIDRICGRALERDLYARYAHAGEMRRDVERVLAARALRRADLAWFIQEMFRDERAAVARHIRDALAYRDDEVLAATADRPNRGPAPIAPIAPIAPRPSLPRITRTPVQDGATETQLVGSATVRTPRVSRWRAAAALSSGIAVVLAIGGRTCGDRAPAEQPDVGAARARTGAAIPRAPEPSLLRLCGSDTIGAELAPALVEAFLHRERAEAIARDASRDGVRLTARVSGALIAIAIHAMDSAAALTALGDRTCDVAVTPREIGDDERAALTVAGLGDMTATPAEHVIGLDGIAVIVHPDNPLAALDRGQLHDIFTGKLTDWSQLGGTPGPITVIARDDRSGAFDAFERLILRGDPLRDGAPRIADASALADRVAGDRTAIGIVGRARVRSARVLAVGEPGAIARLPTPFTVATEGYLLVRRLYLYVSPELRSPLATELIGFALSPQGQAVVRDAGFVELGVTLRDGERCDARCPPSYAALTARAQRLSLDFRFRGGSDELDSRAARDLDRVVQFLRGYPGAKLLLLGFSDEAGLPAASLPPSQHRAAAIASQLELRGIAAATVAGIGAAMPVASSATLADRQRNQRVEVWIEGAR